MMTCHKVHVRRDLNHAIYGAPKIADLAPTEAIKFALFFKRHRHEFGQHIHPCSPAWQAHPHFLSKRFRHSLSLVLFAVTELTTITVLMFHHSAQSGSLPHSFLRGLRNPLHRFQFRFGLRAF